MKKKKKRTCLKSPLSSANSIIIPEPEFYLPDDCWELVFTFLINPVDVFTFLINPIVIVSKQFLSITNRIIFSTTICYPRLRFLPRFFRRFSNLNSLDLSFGGSRDLDASIALALRDRPTLKSLSIYRIDLRDANYITSYYIDSFLSLKGLDSLKFSYSQISDDLLYSIAREGLPLNKFVLQSCTGYSYNGIYDLLSKCPGIQHLGLQDVDFLSNNHLSGLSLLLPDLISINLSECSKLTESTLFAFIKNCRSLLEIKMESIYCERKNVENVDILKDFDVNPQLKFLHFSENSFVNDKIIVIFASIFPNLHLLDLSYCHRISGKSISQVLTRCCKVRYLYLTSCEKVRRIKMNVLIPQLVVLNLSGTSVDDKTLYEISKSCCGLLHLFLIGCKYITENGVIRVVARCRRLKEICFKCCDKVNVDAIISILSSNPSLEKDNCSCEIRLRF
ncbi:unnamed protein product [Lathyrus sativus]|nr:unnamed protein product [Lathyrus sativus]